MQPLYAETKVQDARNKLKVGKGRKFLNCFLKTNNFKCNKNHKNSTKNTLIT